MLTIFKVLVLEDSSSVHKLYQKYFEFFKFDDVEIQYIIVSNLEDAKYQCNVFRPDCALIDLEINNDTMAGLKVSEFFDVNKCAIFSGILNPNIIINCNKLGYFIFVQKPFKFEILKDIVYSFYIKQKNINDLAKREEQLRRKFQENIIIHDALEEQHYLQDTILSTIPASVYIKDIDLKYVTCNNKFLEINNIKDIQDIIGKTDFDIFSDYKAKKYSSEDQNIITSGEPITDILNSSMHRSEFIWTTTSKYPIVLNDSITGVIGIIIDITKNVRLERILENTFDAIKDGICIVDPDKKIVKSNSTLDEWFSDFMPLVGKYCKEIFNDECGFCDECPNSPCETNCEYQYKDHWFNTKYYPINHSGFTICYRRDITAKKLLEEQTKKLQEKLQENLSSVIDEWVEKSTDYDNSLLESINQLDSSVSKLGEKTNKAKSFSKPKPIESKNMFDSIKTLFSG